LKLHYGDGWENLLGQAGAWVLVGPSADVFTAEYLLKRSGEMSVRQPNVGSNLNAGLGVGLSSGEGYGRRPWLVLMTFSSFGRASAIFGRPIGRGNPGLFPALLGCPDVESAGGLTLLQRADATIGRVYWPLVCSFRGGPGFCPVRSIAENLPRSGNSPS
jgi:hypothetical protein